MNKIYFSVAAAVAVCFLCATSALAQDRQTLNLSGKLTAAETFWAGEAVGTPVEGMYGTDYINSFSDGVFSFDNTYTTSDWGDSWSGFAYTNTSDVTTPDYTNMSAITGAGYDDEIDDTYILTYAGGEAIIKFNNRAMFKDLTMYVTNATYAYLSMKEGDALAKKFGGVEGTDPDSLILIATGYDADLQPTGKQARFALADFRFEDSDEDYIVNTWEEFDLSSLGAVSAISFSMETSDMEDFGGFLYPNTPLYFCLDNLSGIADGFIANDCSKVVAEGSVYYANGALFVNGLEGAEIQVFNVMGAMVATFSANGDNEAVLFVSTKGIHIAKAVKEGKVFTFAFNVQ